MVFSFEVGGPRSCGRRVEVAQQLDVMVRQIFELVFVDDDQVHHIIVIIDTDSFEVLVSQPDDSSLVELVAALTKDAGDELLEPVPDRVQRRRIEVPVVELFLDDLVEMLLEQLREPYGLAFHVASRN